MLLEANGCSLSNAASPAVVSGTNVWGDWMPAPIESMPGQQSIRRKSTHTCHLTPSTFATIMSSFILRDILHNPSGFTELGQLGSSHAGSTIENWNGSRRCSSAYAWAKKSNLQNDSPSSKVLERRQSPAIVATMMHAKRTIHVQCSQVGDRNSLHGDATA